MSTLDQTIRAAAALAADGDSNPEYNRALYELIADTFPEVPGELMDERRESVASMIEMARPTAPVVATRATTREAKRHFEAGGAVLVSEYGHEPTQTVTAITTTHDRTRTTWDALAADVKEWRNRYPNQRFYVIPAPVGAGCTCSTDEDACPDHPGDPCPGCGRRSGHDDGCATVARLEYLRGELRGECISMGELHELQTLAPFIDPGDVELLEPAGVPEFPEDAPEEHRLTAATLALLVDALARDEDWSADTLDRLAEVLTVNGYAEARDGQFASTGRAEREAGIAPIR